MYPYIYIYVCVCVCVHRFSLLIFQIFYIQLEHIIWSVTTDHVAGQITSKGSVAKISQIRLCLTMGIPIHGTYIYMLYIHVIPNTMYIYIYIHIFVYGNDDKARHLGC